MPDSPLAAVTTESNACRPQPTSDHRGACDPERVALFGMKIDVLTMQAAVARVLEWLDQPQEDRCRFVVTPNVDHAVMLQTNHALQRVYDTADLVLADGLPIIAASKLVGKPLPERVAGSELVPLLLASVPTTRRLRCFLLGAAPGVAERAAAKIQTEWPGVEVVGCDSPPLGFEQDPAEEARILETLEAAQPELIVVGLGAPKQEIWVHKHHQRMAGKVALCVGATIDFIAGEKAQAPVWMRRSGLEWLHRVITEPRRLAKRYAKDAVVFPRLVLRELVRR